MWAPEIWENRGKKPYTAKADCWSLGVILYQLLCGNFPDTEGKIYVPDTGVKMTGDMWKEISDEAKDLVTKLIQKDPAERLSAVQALLHSWFEDDENVCTEVRVTLGLEDIRRLVDDDDDDNHEDAPLKKRFCTANSSSSDNDSSLPSIPSIPSE